MCWFTLRRTRYSKGVLSGLIASKYDPDVERRVESIIRDVKERGDEALLEYLREFHGLNGEGIIVDEDEVLRAYDRVPPGVIRALEDLMDRVYTVSKSLVPPSVDVETAEGVKVSVKWMPVGSAGLYAPGGRASYPSSVIMAGAAAKAAGVGKLYLSSPPRGREVDPGILVAADIVGVRRVYRLGGAYAAAAMALGTETVERVDLIAGPGGIWFTVAKKLLYGVTGIDFLAGPTELFILADGSVDASWLAWDIAAQAEHSPDTLVILASPNAGYLDEVLDRLERVVASTPTGEVVRSSLESNGLVLDLDSMDDGVNAVNEAAPEHLYLAVSGGEDLLPRIRNAGSISIGAYTPPALTDYSTGANHILPTMGWARFRGGLTPLDFLKAVYINTASKDGFFNICRGAVELGFYEGLYSHARSIIERGCRRGNREG
ncbi:MAG: histidinol dehydrogenase [Desulfurococcales archaeon]|nr:histidinol dehydrogenase [Desulfurococcales archaeon]